MVKNVGEGLGLIFQECKLRLKRLLLVLALADEACTPVSSVEWLQL
jgi:hypothetical protein